MLVTFANNQKNHIFLMLANVSPMLRMLSQCLQQKQQSITKQDMINNLIKFGLKNESELKKQNAPKNNYGVIQENIKAMNKKEQAATEKDDVMQTSQLELPKLSTSSKLIQMQTSQIGRLQQVNAFNMKSGQSIPEPPKMLKLNTIEQNEMVADLESLIDSLFINESEKDTVGKLITEIKEHKLLNNDDIDKLRMIEDKYTKATKMTAEAEITLKRLENNMQSIEEKFHQNLTQIRNSYNGTLLFKDDEINFLLQVEQQLIIVEKIACIKKDLGEKLTNEHVKVSDQTISEMRQFLQEIENIKELNLLIFKYKGLLESYELELKNEEMLIKIRTYLNYEYLGKDHKETLELILNRDRFLKSDEIKQINDIFESCDNIEQLKPYYERMGKLLAENRKLEEQYPREKGYSMSISGKGIFDFDNQMKARQREITRCTKVKTFTVVELRRQKTDEEQNSTEEEFNELLLNETSGEREIFITVKTYDDLCKLMKPWPSDAFDKGVKPKLEPIGDFQIVILNIEKDICKTRLESVAEEMEVEYGIVNLKRQYIKNDLKYPSTTLNA
jgi:hypothetical protein